MRTIDPLFVLLVCSGALLPGCGESAETANGGQKAAGGMAGSGGVGNNGYGAGGTGGGMSTPSLTGGGGFGVDAGGTTNEPSGGAAGNLGVGGNTPGGSGGAPGGGAGGGPQVPDGPRPAKSKPNVIIVFVDDLGYADLGVYGSGSAPAGAPWKAWDSLPIKTPRLDQMAAAGVRFTSFYSGSPTCTRSRAGLLTGSYAMRVGFPDGVLTPASAVGLNPNEVTLPTLLKARGYRTAMFGKWHLGHKPKFLPTAHGFDEYMGVPYSNDMAIDPDMTLAAGVVLGKDLTGQDWTAQRILALKGATKEERDRLDADQVPLLRGTEVVEYPVDQSTLTRRYTDEAIRFMSENKAHPFFIYVPHSMPHTPLHPSAEFAGKSARGKYGDVVEELDFHVGRLLDAVKDQGLESNTLVVFTSDNGPWAAKGIDGGTAYPFNGAKFSTWEGGMRVPAIMRWPGQIASGLVQDEPASVIDLYPTLAKLTGGDVPPNRVTDGEDIWPIVTGQAGANHGPFYYDLSAIRDGNWKLRHDVVGDGGQLYDLSKDPHEDSDLSASNAQVKQMLQAQLDKFKAELEANKRPVGTNDTQVLPKGCTNKAAPNYNATAQIDDGSCGVQ